MRAIPPRVSAVASALVLTVLAGCSGGAGSAAVSVRDPAVGARCRSARWLVSRRLISSGNGASFRPVRKPASKCAMHGTRS